MLSLFRQRGLTSVIYGAIICAMIAVFIIGFRPTAGQKTASINEACAATVRGRCIDPKEQRAAFRLLIPRDQQGNLLTGRAKSMGLMKIATDGLVDRELLCAEADRIGVSVSDDEVSDEIIAGYIRVSTPSDRPDMAASLRVGDGRLYIGFKDPKTKAFDQKTYERTIRNLVGRSSAEFRESQARELLAAKMRDIVRSPVRISEGEALDSYVSEKSSAAIIFVPVSQRYISKYAVPFSDADVEKWAADKDNAKKIDELVAQRRSAADPKPNHIRHILVRVEKGATADQKSEALGMLAVAVGRLKRGDAFADVAREFSQDPGSAEQGGDVGDKTDGFVAPFRDAANALKPGETTTSAVETQFGYHLIER
ncbi:MAG: peptidylprolyl isomerase, partial [Polyangiaceae bacterium]